MVFARFVCSFFCEEVSSIGKIINGLSRYNSHTDNTLGCHVLLKKGILGIFKITLLDLRDQHVFVTISENIFWKTKTFFKKLEYCFLVKSTKIENASFS